MNGLSQEAIAELLGKTRGRNSYGPKLAEFMESDEAGINPREIWPAEFGNKSAAAMYQSFRKAAEVAKIADKVQISQVDGEVYILNKEKVALALAELAEAANAANATDTDEVDTDEEV